MDIHIKYIDANYATSFVVSRLRNIQKRSEGHTKEINCHRHNWICRKTLINKKFAKENK